MAVSYALGCEAVQVRKPAWTVGIHLDTRRRICSMLSLLTRCIYIRECILYTCVCANVDVYIRMHAHTPTCTPPPRSPLSQCALNFGIREDRHAIWLRKVLS